MSCGVNVMAERPSPICHNVKVQNIKPNIVIIYSKVPLVPPGLSCGVLPWDVSSGSLWVTSWDCCGLDIFIKHITEMLSWIVTWGI